MTDHSPPRGITCSQHVHEILFSLNSGFLIIIAVFWKGPDSVVSWLFRMNGSINISVHLRQSDLATAHFVSFIFGILLALCIWAILRLSSHVRLTKEILYSASGIAALVALPVMHLWGHPSWWWRYGLNPLEIMQVLDLALILFCAFWYLYHRWPIPSWGGGVILGAHYVFWSREFGVYPFWFGVGDPVAWLAGLCSSLAWAFYIYGGRHGAATNLVSV